MQPPLRFFALVTTLTAALGAGSCGGGEESSERWVHLAAGFRPAPLEGSLTAHDGRAVTLRSATDDSLLLEFEVAADDWRPTPWTHLVRIALPLVPSTFPSDVPAEPSLSDPSGLWTFEVFDVGKQRIDPADFEPGTFSVEDGFVYLAIPKDGVPPPAVEVKLVLDRGREQNRRWRVPIGSITADGIPVVPGFAEEVPLEAPPGSVLRLTTALHSPGGEVAASFRIRLDGEPLFEETQAGEPGGSWIRREIPLPVEGVRGGTLRFEVEGEAALAAFLTPVVGPAEIGRPGQRPWAGEEAERPDVVLFVADTFRADYMAAYGGTLELTPFLDGFAGECQVFERMWSNATWTLPGHASVFTGLQPPQHTATMKTVALPAEAATLAEHFLGYGYRTAAVTDGLYLTRAYGLDQGFEWFDEGRDTELEEKIDAALEAVGGDDGRPLFLFVHTYETHMPYDVSARTRAEHGERWDFSDQPGKIERFFSAVGTVPEGVAASPEIEEAARDLRGIVFGTVLDLDRGMERFVESTRASGFLEHAFLVFTSDHGEAFLEHDGFGMGDGIGHGDAVWEEFVRIPLLIHGPGLTPGRRAESASLVDVPRTVAELAGLAPDPRWGGMSLVELGEDRPVLLFGIPPNFGPSTVGLVLGDRKVILPLADDGTVVPRVLHAYDLAADPEEQAAPLEGGTPPEWALDLMDRVEAELRDALEPRMEQERLRLSLQKMAELKKLGY